MDDYQVVYIIEIMLSSEMDKSSELHSQNREETILDFVIFEIDCCL